MARSWVVFSLLVVCASIYPFDFQPRPLDLADFRAFLASCCRPLVWREGLSSVLLFVPFGFLGVAAARRGSSLFARLVLVTLLGLLLALALQVVQVYLPSRAENLQDVGWTTLGVVAGGLLGAAIYKYTRGSLSRLPGGKRRASAATGYVPVTVNFRSRTVVILENVAREVGCNLPALCRLILDTRLGEAGDGSRETDNLAAVAVKKLMLSVPQEEAAGNSAVRKPVALWQKRTIDLTRDQFLKVRLLADSEEQSLSRTIRHIIADFLEGRGDPSSEARAPQGQPAATRHKRKAPERTSEDSSSWSSGR
jgi:VanZ family protein